MFIYGKSEAATTVFVFEFLVQLFLNSTPPLPLRELETGERTLRWAGQVRIRELCGIKGRVDRSQKEMGSIPGKENRTRKGIEIKKNILSTFKAYDTIQINPTYLILVLA